MSRQLLSVLDLTPEEVLHVVRRGIAMRTLPPGERPLRGKSAGIYFARTSTRTRTSFGLGAARLGAWTLTYGPGDLQTNTGESVEDTARILGLMLDLLVMRTSGPIAEMEAFAAQPGLAVVNAMSEGEHPTQALADLTTLQEHFGRLEDLHLLYVGEGNNTATALALAAARLPGVRLTLRTPAGYGLPPDLLATARGLAAAAGAVVEESHEPDFPGGVDAVYATRWQTTGTTKPDPEWRRHFAPFAVTPALMARVSRPDGSTVFMHDLPAHRGEDVESEVLDGPQSIAWRQAQNKLFSAMAVLEFCALG